MYARMLQVSCEFLVSMSVPNALADSNLSESKLWFVILVKRCAGQMLRPVFRGKKAPAPVKKPAPKVRPTIRTTRSQDLMKSTQIWGLSKSLIQVVKSYQEAL